MKFHKLQYKGISICHIRKMLLPLCLLLTVLTGCKDELEIVGQGGGGDEIEGDCLAFVMKLDKDLSTRDDEEGDGFSIMGPSDITKYDNYIDTQDKFRVFFFTKEGDFLFGATDRVVGSYENTDNSASYWYVRIPMTMIVDRDNQEYDIDKIKSYLKNNDFKIAVLANWPNAGDKINPADYDDSEGTNSAIDNPSSELKGNPRWNWSNSILNKDADPKDIRNINDLHHVYKDDYYGASSGVFGNFMAHVVSGDDAGYYMGEPSDWVKFRDITGKDGWKATYPLDDKVKDFAGKTSANRWIRANWTPDVTLNQEKKIYRHYQHMWFLWNFDASFKYGEWLEDNPDITDEKELKAQADEYYGRNWGWNDNTQAALANPRGKEWYERNGYLLYKNWMKKSYNEGKTPQPIGSYEIQIGESNNDVFFKYFSALSSGQPAYCVNVNNNYGIQLPNIGSAQVRTNSTGIITFQARTSGTLRVKWGSKNAERAGLAVQKGEYYGSSSSTIQRIHTTTSTVPVDWVNSADNNSFIDITVEGASVPIFIYCTQGSAVVYSIEFIRGKYLYETDREGVAPSAVQGIPMYGVQDFKAIGDWQRGTTHNLEGNVSLIRALAKVEVYIKSDFGEPRHVYMRNMNRAARCEPMDVHTATHKIWSSEHDEDNCEWFAIQKYGPSFQLTTNYSDWLSWFYGSWKYNDKYEKAENENSGYKKYEPIHWKSEGTETKYVYNRDKGYFVPNGNLKGWKESAFTYTTEVESPHVFNPYIYPSDFCRFLYVGRDTQGGGYYRYVLYVPEKNIDDPATVGNTASTPRVPHIEYRFFPINPASASEDEIAGAADKYSNSEYNLDDNDCYRIYFTNYGTSKNEGLGNMPENQVLKSGINRDGYDDYEKNKDHLELHWPIMRNHNYKFFIGGTGPENPDIHVQVTDWGHRKVVLEW